MLKTTYQQFIHKSKYARWLYEDNRYERWSETVSRYMNFMRDHLHQKLNYKITDKLYQELYDAILDCKIMPSMRCMMTAGEALKKDNAAGYNCAYLPIGPVDNEDPKEAVRCFSEILYLLMCGCGVGYSVERKFVDNLPQIAKFDNLINVHPIKVDDSRLGWCSALDSLIVALYRGIEPKIDFSEIRPAGTDLKTFGGTAAGPEPLKKLFDFTIQLFKNAEERKLTPLECHDLCCMIADVTIIGGVRRAALISLSDLDDDEMRTCKSLENIQQFPHRTRANNSAVYSELPTEEDFAYEWKNLKESGSGERGLFSRVAVKDQFDIIGRPYYDGIGVNPCGEVNLRPFEFCNLAEIVLPNTGTFMEITKLVELATTISTFQSTLTDFRFLRPQWKHVCEEERLLGVSFTGIAQVDMYNANNKVTRILLSEYRVTAKDTNKRLAEELGINASVGITTIKPSGTVSQLVGCTSGIHEAYAEYYLRTVRGNKKDPMMKFLKDVGFYIEDDVQYPELSCVVYFPQRTVLGTLRNERNALEQLAVTKLYQDFWCDHNVSRTIYVKENEWDEVGEWVFENLDEVRGLSFLPYCDDDHIYEQAPLQEISQEDYESWVEKTPKNINWDALDNYTNGTKEALTGRGSEYCGLAGCDG